MVKQVSIGKYRALQRASDDDGVFTILAIDHQDALRRLLAPDAPHLVTGQELVTIKQQVTGTLQDIVSGVLLDPVYGAAQAIAGGLPSNVGLLAELEKADYDMAPLPLEVEIRPNWSVDAIKRMGADGVKLFYYDDRDDVSLSAQQDQTLRQVVADCARYDIPLYAEPIIINASPKNRQDKILRSAIHANDIGADVLKLEFPIDTSDNDDREVWRAACLAVTEAVQVPWVLLSAGVDFDVYAQQVEVACRAGASGYIAGRAIWGEACSIENHDERAGWLKSVARERLHRLNEIVAATATLFTEIYQPEPVTTKWYASYPTIHSQ